MTKRASGGAPRSAIGHVGLRDGVDPLVCAPRRQRSGSAADGRVRARSDRRPARARSAGRARSAIRRRSCRAAPPKRSGLIGDRVGSRRRSAAMLVADRAIGRARQPPAADDADARRDTPAAAFRLGVYALVRLKAYDPLAAAVLDRRGQPRVRWWPVAFALQRLEDKRALPALMTLARDAESVHARVRRQRARRAEGSRSALPALMPLLSSGERSVLIETDSRARPHRRSVGGAAAAEVHHRRE